MRNKYLSNLFNLHKDEDDRETVLRSIRANIYFTGSNLWTLACAIIIASIGLNVNSTAVIIGAMLISPLMGPIMASGFALGIYDFELLQKALKNLLLATVVSLLCSTIYFTLSPFKEAQSEILARTSPNIYDILIAFFGGIVGVIASTRVEKGNPIPGVAIATALMPPLCTCGYALATGHWDYFIGSLFLYSINCVFICIATYVIVKILKYPAKQQVDELHAKRVKYIITGLTILMLLPGIYLAFELYQKQKFTSNVSEFVNQSLNSKGYTVIYQKTNYNTTPKTIELAFLSHHFDSSEINTLENQLISHGLLNTKLIIKQDSATNLAELKNSIVNEIQNHTNDGSINAADESALKQELEKYQFDNVQLQKEATAAFPFIDQFSVGLHDMTKGDSTFQCPVALYHTRTSLSEPIQKTIYNWAKMRLDVDTLVLVPLGK